MSTPEPDFDAQKRQALDLILEAWDSALRAGVAPEILASAAIYAALVDMIDRFGAEAVADFAASLPERIRRGEFTLAKTEDSA